MRNTEYQGPPWSASEFGGDMKALRADAEMLVRNFGNPQPYVPTNEQLKRDAEVRAEAVAYLNKLDTERTRLQFNNLRSIQERQEQRVSEIWRSAEARVLSKRKTG